MLTNRSIPHCTVIPVLIYPDVAKAAEWLCQAFGFTVRLRIGNHRVQLNAGEGALVVAEGDPAEGENSHSVMVRVEDIDRHYQRSREHGARELHAPADHPYGERQYSVQDFAGHRWTFTQSIADVDPAEWGGEAVER